MNNNAERCNLDPLHPEIHRRINHAWISAPTNTFSLVSLRRAIPEAIMRFSRKFERLKNTTIKSPAS